MSETSTANGIDGIKARMNALEAVLAAAREFLKGGAHEGPCSNAPGGRSVGGPCWEHLYAGQERKKRLEVAIKAAE